MLKLPRINFSSALVIILFTVALSCFLIGSEAYSAPSSAYLLSSYPVDDNPGWCDTLFQVYPFPDSIPIPWHVD